MEMWNRYKEEYAAYREKRGKENKITVILLGIWAVLLVPAIMLGTWILWEITGYFCSDIVKALGGFALLILGSFFVNWPIVVVKTTNNHIDRLTCNMSMKFMAQALEETLGPCSQDAVRYRVIQVKSAECAQVERNQRIAWLGQGEDFLVHRARITETDSDDNTLICFDGMAFSVPVMQSQWSVRNNEKDLQRLSREWEDQLYIDGKKPIFSLDRFENRLWLSVGYSKLRLGEEDIPWQDLERWHNRCSKDAQIVKKIRDKLMKIATET